MNKKWSFIALCGLLLGGFQSCKDVVNELPDTPYVTTPYQFTFDETLLPRMRLPEDNPLTNEGVYLGRMLFYDPILSADSTQSCGSCHNQQMAFSDNGKRVSTGIRGLEGPRNSMPIFNLAWHTDGFFWDGRSEILRHQALIPIEDPLEMDETIGNMLVKLNRSSRYLEEFKKAFGAEEIDEELVGKALEQFMLSIVSVDSKYDRVKRGLDSFTNQEKVGQRIFNAESITMDEEPDPSNPVNFGGDCFHCHAGDLFMIREFTCNGLPASTLDDRGRGAITNNALDDYKFKTVSLRNIELTAPYMHDGRFNSLEEVVQHYLGPMENSACSLVDEPLMHALQDSVYLSNNHKAALVAFLKTLTDESLLIDERYSNPFE